MSDIIRLLPDSVANQIAAGEVIQRPASVVKELIENSVDAGASSIKIIIKDAGKTLVQVIDNGCGMSEKDCRMSFERHATSKIKTADDLFAIRTMGFRGEALASIAAIAQVEMRTKRFEDELGSRIVVEGSEVILQEPISCPQGTNFMVKNIFYNVPARRKFLKADTTEFKNIINEIQRVALANPDIAMILNHNNEDVYNLSSGNHRQRIVQLFGKNINQHLVSVNTDTSMLKISGFIGKPEIARKKGGEQFFFINNRYMRHPYFYNAVVKAYENILPPDMSPSFFLFFEADTSTIDINIHPTKTEIKFEEEQAIYQIIHVTIKEGLGKFNVMASIDFNQNTGFAVPYVKKDTEIRPPEIRVNPDFNPFLKENSPYSTKTHHTAVKHWEKLYEGLKNENTPDIRNESDIEPFSENENYIFSGVEQPQFLQLKGKYILTPVKSGLMIIDQRRAHERILYDNYLSLMQEEKVHSQKSLFPESINFNPDDFEIIKELIPDLKKIGYDIEIIGKNSIMVNGVPANEISGDLKTILDSFLETSQSGAFSTSENKKEQLALVLAKSNAINYGKMLEYEEMTNIFNGLFAGLNPNFTPSGKLIVTIVSINDVETLFK
ncbi:MAG: DNA mismatch repair endonuclease MutL [Bacteroidales bacterium]|nr:DNA mismatch repair endonuclease MutL [Bacteroidales bacterium]